MLFINDNIRENRENLILTINSEINYIHSIEKNQNKQKDFLLNYMQKFATSTEYIDSTHAEEIGNFLGDLKNFLNIANNNIEILHNIIQDLEELKRATNSSDFESFNLKYKDLYRTCFSQMASIEEFLYSSFEKYFDFNYSFSFNKEEIPNNEEPFNLSDAPVETEDTITDNQQPTPQENNELETSNIEDSCENSSIDLNKIHTITEQSNEPDEEIIFDNDFTSINNNDLDNEEIPINDNVVTDTGNYIPPENTLVISENKGFVYLPFDENDIQKKLKKEPNSSKLNIIHSYYTRPYKYYKNHSMARFKEAFSLMKNKEHTSIIEAFDLGMEMFFNYDLHPAIISACHNLDELDIYLDCLESKETNKFNCFKIIFDIPPTISKK